MYNIEKDQIKIVLQYLEMETNHAIIINGKYGIGKTHFFKNDLVPAIKEVSKKGQKIFIPIYISLFGYKNLEEIHTAIFLELFPILKDKKIKFATGIVKSIIRGIVQLGKLGNIDDYIKDIKPESEDLLEYTNLVICFDDLDRKSESLKLSEVFGFINSLVENRGAKVLIIADEEKLSNDPIYSPDLREKVIGVTIQYKPEIGEIFDKVILQRYIDNNNYYKFLVEYKNAILEVIEVNGNNIRNLVYFLEHFKIIFFELENLFDREIQFTVMKVEKLKAVFNFTIAIAIENKSGFLNSSNQSYLQQIDRNPSMHKTIDVAKNLDSNDQKPEQSDFTYKDSFAAKYYSKGSYYFFKSILNYITGINAFDINILKSELDKYFVVKDGKIPEHEEVLERLEYFACLRLADKAYRSLTIRMLHFVDEGSYRLKQYYYIFSFAIRFNNILNYDIPKLKKRFEKGIFKGKTKYVYDPDLAYFTQPSREDEFFSDVLDIRNVCLNINDSIKPVVIESNIEKTWELFYHDFDSFLRRVNERESEFKHVPFWTQIDVKKVYRRIGRLDNEQIWKFGDYFIRRYNFLSENLASEGDFVTNLSYQINLPKKRKIKNLRNACLDYFSKRLIESKAILDKNSE